MLPSRRACRRLDPVLAFVAQVGQRSLQSLREVGYHAALLAEAFYWLLLGRWRRQPVRLRAVFKEAIGVGVNAIPIVALASFATGMMLAIQGIYTLRTFGAEGQVVLGISLSVTREFAPLITGIFVAGPESDNLSLGGASSAIVAGYAGQSESANLNTGRHYFCECANFGSFFCCIARTLNCGLI